MTIWVKTGAVSPDEPTAEWNTQAARAATKSVDDDKSNKTPGTFSSLKKEILQGRDHQNERGNDDCYERECRNGAEEPANAKTKQKKDRVAVGRNKEPPRASTLSRLLFSSKGEAEGKRDQLKVVYRQFGPDAKSVLSVEREEGMPSPEAPDHVVVKIQASTVTLEDCKIRCGFDFNVFHPICLPQTPGSDIVGHICAAGSKAFGFKEGDRVAALVRTGGNARYLSVPASSLVKIPRNLESAEAVAMVSIYTTAYQTLKRITQKGPLFSLLGKKVLIIGGMDAVGQALIQMCNKARAEIYATCPERHNAYILNILGAAPLPENKEKWLPMVRGEMDFVFDGLCEDGLNSSHKALKKKGELVCYGYASMLKQRNMGLFGAPLSAHVNKLWSITQSRTKTVDIWESFQDDPDTYKKNLKSLMQLLKWSKIKPHIAKAVTLSEVANAQTQLESGELQGTVICLPWNKEDTITRKN